MGTLLRWIGLAAATGVAAVAFDRIGLPSAALFAALLVGVAAALSPPWMPDVSPGVFRAAQAITGASLGVYVQSSSLNAVASAWLPVALVSAGTLFLSLLCGWALTRTVGLDPPTAALGMIAGGASGIVGMAHELGADDRLVAVMQYLRVLVVVVLTPVLVALAFAHPHGGGGGPSPANAPVLGTARDWLLMSAALGVGALVAVVTRIPAGSLLGPMVAAAVLTLVVGDFQVPALVRQPAFAAIGLQVGLRFTPGLLREAGRLLLPTLLCIGGLLVACFGLALILAATTDASLLDAYLATTPGGLYAVLAAAFGTGADTTFVIAVQTLRLFVMILLAPLVVRRLVLRNDRKIVPAADADSVART
ncbi:MAG TPA: AbrB family transcriptional regulator [Thermoleophilaceae bacterium]|nr:AbrB family transcriptional regulator [Thermoleophilaceae bacterium]